MDTDQPVDARAKDPSSSKGVAPEVASASSLGTSQSVSSPHDATGLGPRVSGKDALSRKEALASEAISFFKTLAIFFAAAFLIKASVVEAFKIPSLSMWPTLRVGDQLLVCKFSYGLRLPFLTKTVFEYDAPRRGDIVVFTRPDDPSTNIIKRVIGLPGDTVEVKGMTVFINNQIYREPYARWENHGSPGGSFDSQRVPDHHIFLLGDNRDASKDSRFWDNPFLDLKLVKGRALLIYWSWEDLGRVGNILR